jgi:ABC-2 type transport system ATP-binding protein
VVIQEERRSERGGSGDDGIVVGSSLTKVFSTGRQQIRAVDDFDLSVHEGEILGLLGPNGAGKTTTVGMFTTRVIPTSGTARIAGVDVVANPTRVKQLIGVVSQQNTLDRSVTVWENLYFHGRYFGMSARDARAAADEGLERFRLTDRASSDVDKLSGGMSQRLMVARAILHRPSVLFLDEPTAGLDPQSRLALWDMMRDLNSRGQTILMTTHYMEEADTLCDRVAIMDHGRLLALDAPGGLKRNLGADREVRMTAEGNLQALADHLRSIEGASSALVVDGVVHLHLRGSEGRLPHILAHAEDGGFTVTDVSVKEPTLETVFINLTGRELRE